MATMTATHQWVKHTVTPVHLITDADGEPMLDSDGQPVLIVDPDQQQVSEEDTVYGCMNCGEALVTALDQPCQEPQ